MDVTATNSLPGSAATKARSALATNFDTFLQLLTAQLKHQDPTSPLDTNEFTQQLVQYSQVEQQLSTNSSLENLIALTRANAGAAAVSYLGRTVVTKGPEASLSKGNANWTYELPSTAQSVQLLVTDAQGRIVHSRAGELGAGEHAFEWDGKGANGVALADGTYKLEVRALGAGGTPMTATTYAAGLITEADLSQGDPLMMIGTRKIKLSDIHSIRHAL